MNPKGPLTPDRLRRRCDPALFDFDTTHDIAPLNTVIGQDRAIEAIDFGIRIRRGGYNLFAAGPTGSGKHYVARSFLKQQAVDEPAPDDWCYVHNTADPHRPHALRLPPGKGRPLRDHMEQVLEELQSLIPTALQSDAYRTSRNAAERNFKDRQERFLREIQHQANERGLALIQTDEGIAIAPMRDGAILSQEKIQTLPSDEQDSIAAHIKEVQQELMEQSALLPQWERETMEAIRTLDQQVCRAAVEPVFQRLASTYQDLPAVLDWFDAIREDMIHHHHLFIADPEQDNAEALLRGRGREQRLRRYHVNVLIDHTGASGAPVVYEDHPTLSNLMGRIEHTAMLGALTTDFRLIRPGALHRANGGYLIIDAHRLLSEPMAWDFLKRTIRSGELRIEAPDRGMSHISTVTLEPEPIPITIKVVLIGERALYHTLERYDADFRKMFKVLADFDEHMDWNDNNTHAYSHLIATLARQDNLRPFTREAVARLVEHAARLAQDSRKLSTHIQSLWSILHESDHQARVQHSPHTTAHHVREALAASERRRGRPRQRLHEQISQGRLMIDTTGSKIGQLNGLSVLQLSGGILLGQPNRITARARPGKGGVVNIEREATLSGPIHDKGVLILSSLLGARYTLG
ncbi:MAG: ATP-binding protein, partial [Myxococcota bacterium]